MRLWRSSGSTRANARGWRYEAADPDVVDEVVVLPEEHGVAEPDASSSPNSSGLVSQGDRSRLELMATHELELDPLS
jgi:hypothetical protein